MKKGTILLLEEDVQQANHIRNMIETTLQYKVQLGFSPGSIKMSATDKHFDLIILGWTLEGVKIFEFRRFLDELLPILKVPMLVLFFAYSDEKLEQARIKPGEIEFLVSPFSDFYLLNRVESFIKKNTVTQSDKISLVVSDRWIKLLSELGGVVVWELDCKHETMYFTKTFGQMFNYPHEKLPGHFGEFISLIHPEEREEFERRMYGHIKQNITIFSFEHRIKHNTHDYRWVFNRGQITDIDQNGQPVKMVGIMVDITYKKMLQNERVKHLHQMESREE